MRPAMLGWLLVLLGLVLEVWSAAELGWRRWLGMTDAPPDPILPRLVLAGPFRVVRHPQCLGLLLLVAGVVLLSRATAMWLAGSAVAAWAVLLACRDDRRMAVVHGEAYDRYRRSVPFITPRLRRGMGT